MRATLIGHINLACNARASVESIMDMRQKLPVLIFRPDTKAYYKVVLLNGIKRCILGSLPLQSLSF